MLQASPYQAPATLPLEDRSKRNFWKRAIWASAITIIVPPMFGLAGTLIGMIRAFGVLKTSGGADPAALAGDISIALITTLTGLVFSVIGLILLVISIIRFRSCGAKQQTD